VKDQREAIFMFIDSLTSRGDKKNSSDKKELLADTRHVSMNRLVAAFRERILLCNDRA
jgi:hypothetical protein